MKVLFVVTHFNFWAPLDPVARSMANNGVEVRVLIDKERNDKFSDRYKFGDDGSYFLGWSTTRSDIWRYFVFPLRELISYISYVKLRVPTSKILARRWADYLPRGLRWFALTSFGKSFFSSDLIWNALRRIESMVPVANNLLNEIEGFSPDLVVASSAIMPFSRETDYLKAAQYLQMPTVVVIPSWDNLTTKGMLQVIPDRLLVWNDRLGAEATALHFVPESKVVATGALKFDPWFEIKPVLDRKTVCAKLGIEPDADYFIYLCSSEFIAGSAEQDVVGEIALQMEKAFECRKLRLLVRPHPQNMSPWRQCLGGGTAVLWSDSLQAMGVDDTVFDFFHALYFSRGVVGVNTSAFIETAIVDKPCIALATEQFSATQSEIPHFQHLVDFEFLDVASSIPQVVEAMRRLLEGGDTKVVARRRFVREFIRPKGLDKSVGDVVAELFSG